MPDEKRPDQSRNRMSRRTVLKLTGAGAAIAWTTPIIASVRMPAFAATSVPCGTEVFRDGFEQEGCGVPEPGLDNWASVAGSVDVIGGSCGTQYVTTPSKVLDLAGTPCPDVNTVIETNTLFPAGSYQVEFDLGGSQRGDAPNTVVVTFGSLSQSITLASGDPLSTQGPFAATVGAGGARLRFEHVNDDCIGLLLDNVVIRSCP